MIDDLIAFLHARLDDREALATGAMNPEDDNGEWETSKTNESDAQVDGDAITIYDEGGHSRSQAEFIAANDPAYVLRDIAVKRRIIALYTHVQMSRPMGNGLSMPLGGDGPEIYYDVLCLMAMIDVEHPDYNPAWNKRDAFYGAELKGLET